MTMLVPGDKFPDIEISLPEGESVVLPADVHDFWVYVLFYRGGW